MVSPFNGLCLALTHVATFFLWRTYFYGPSMMNGGAPSGPSVCWPFFPQCYLLNFSLQFTSWLGTTYLFCSVITCGLFCLKRVRAAYWSLLFLCLFKIAIMCIDYRLMGDYHYITLIVSSSFLLLPNKWTAPRILIVLFYFFAGTLKFNQEWLSGSALIDDPKIYGLALEWLCLYVIILETCLSPLLLFAKSSFVRYLTLFQFACFHLYSYLIVGFFFPTIYFLLLMIFPLAWSGSKNLKVNKKDLFVIGCFVLAQLVPVLQNGDPALVGRGRHFAVHIMDATSECYPLFYVRYDHETIEVQGNRQILSFRIRCDPLVYWNQAWQLCRKHEREPGFRRVEFSMTTRRLTDSKFTQIAAVEDFCKEALEYNTLRSNDWMSE